jgi:hypothetical protein
MHLLLRCWKSPPLPPSQSGKNNGQHERLSRFGLLILASVHCPTWASGSSQTTLAAEVIIDEQLLSSYLFARGIFPRRQRHRPSFLGILVSDSTPTLLGRLAVPRHAGNRMHCRRTIPTFLFALRLNCHTSLLILAATDRSLSPSGERRLRTTHRLQTGRSIHTNKPLASGGCALTTFKRYN